MRYLDDFPFEGTPWQLPCGKEGIPFPSSASVNGVSLGHQAKLLAICFDLGFKHAKTVLSYDSGIKDTS